MPADGKLSWFQIIGSAIATVLAAAVLWVGNEGGFVTHDRYEKERARLLAELEEIAKNAQYYRLDQRITRAETRIIVLTDYMNSEPASLLNAARQREIGRLKLTIQTAQREKNAIITNRNP